MATIPPAAEATAAPSNQPVEVSASGEQGQPQAAAKEAATNNGNKRWDSELHLVSSLSKLQELEARIHQLRTLLPDRIMAPMAPIISPIGAAPDNPIPRSPEALLARLSQAAHGGVAEIEQFQAAWRSPEMKDIWEHVGEKIKEDGGKLLQPTGMWETDYGVVLEELVRNGGDRKMDGTGDWEGGKENKEEEGEEEAGRSVEEVESVVANWRADLEVFLQKGISGVRIRADENEPLITIGLVKAGLLFQARAMKEFDGDISKWRVSSVVLPGKFKTKLEIAICDCLNSRRRQWDLTYLLELTSSYSDIKQAPCAKCNKLTDNAAQLPIFRVPVPAFNGLIGPSGPRLGPPAQGSRSNMELKPFHAGCV